MRMIESGQAVVVTREVEMRQWADQVEKSTKLVYPRCLKLRCHAGYTCMAGERCVKDTLIWLVYPCVNHLHTHFTWRKVLVC